MNEEQFEKLTKYFDERFEEQNAKLVKRLAEQDERLEKRLVGQDVKFEDAGHQFAGLSDQMLKLYQHFEQRTSELESKLDAKASQADMERVLGALDTILKNQETEQQERLATNRQLDRHEGWHHEVADKVGVKLGYER
jgi:sulfite reductase alpha subunit-like flavoprotein